MLATHLSSQKAREWTIIDASVPETPLDFLDFWDFLDLFLKGCGSHTPRVGGVGPCLYSVRVRVVLGTVARNQKSHFDGCTQRTFGQRIHTRYGANPGCAQPTSQMRATPLTTDEHAPYSKLLGCTTERRWTAESVPTPFIEIFPSKGSIMIYRGKTPDLNGLIYLCDVVMDALHTWWPGLCLHTSVWTHPGLSVCARSNVYKLNTKTMIYIPLLLVNRFKKKTLLIVWYIFSKHCSHNFYSPGSDPSHPQVGRVGFCSNEWTCVFAEIQHFIEFVLVQTNQLFDNDSNVILTR